MTTSTPFIYPTTALRLKLTILFFVFLPCCACRTQRRTKKKEGRQKGHPNALILLLTLEMLEIYCILASQRLKMVILVLLVVVVHLGRLKLNEKGQRSWKWLWVLYDMSHLRNTGEGNSSNQSAAACCTS